MKTDILFTQLDHLAVTNSDSEVLQRPDERIN